MAQPASNRTPTFFWQGTLILLPVLVLVGLGLWSLQRDKALARQEAAQRAQELAETLASQLWQGLTAAEPDSPHQFRVNRQGQLVFPPSVDLTPVPQPLDPKSLSPQAATLWQTARRAEATGADPQLAVRSYRAFLEQNPPRQFAAEAHYATGLLLARETRAQAAWEQFRIVENRFADISGESGLPLTTLAALKLAEAGAVSGARANADLENLCSNLVEVPTAVTPLALGLLVRSAGSAEAKQTVQRWQIVWEEQSFARELYAAAEQSLRGGWVWLTPLNRQQSVEPWLAIPTSGDSTTNITYVCRSRSELQARILALAGRAGTLPRYFGLSIELAQRPLNRLELDANGLPGFAATLTSGDAQPKTSSGETLRSEREAALLATAAAPAPAAGQVRVKVYLAMPAALFAFQRARTRWFAALIGAAALAALIGFAAAYRAFHRQLRLTELKSNFVSSVSHELRAPIASVRLLAESLERGKVPGGAKQQEYFHFIVQECRRLSSLIENVLDFSRIEQGRKQYDLEPTDLAALVDQTVKLMAAYAAEKQLRIELSRPLSGPNPAVQARLDGKAIQQALVNLLDNAIKHSPTGGTIKVGLDLCPGCARAESVGSCAAISRGNSVNPVAHGEQKPGTIELWVQDHGEGIPPEEHEKIFERFYRRGSELRRQTQGVGIGLSIVKHIVEAHGGRVRVESQVGQGSRFVIVLPQQGADG